MKRQLLLFIVLICLVKCNNSDRDTKSDKKRNSSENLEIKGRFILKDANCAGYDFFNSKIIIWRNELTCNDPDTFSIYWLDKSTFLIKDIKIENKNCPPRVSVYKVDSFDGNNLQLLDIWTGWGDYKIDTLQFVRLIKNQTP